MGEDLRDVQMVQQKQPDNNKQQMKGKKSVSDELVGVKFTIIRLYSCHVSIVSPLSEQIMKDNAQNIRFM